MARPKDKDRTCWETEMDKKRNVLQVNKAVNLLELVLAQADLRTLNVLLQVLDRGGARNSQDRWGTVQQPGQCNLTGCRLMVLDNLIQDTPWTCQVADPLRMPGNKADALTCAQVDHCLGLLNIHPDGLRFLQIIVVLHRHNRHYLLCQRKLINGHIGETNVTNLSLRFHLRKFAHRVLKWNIWIGIMQLVHINLIDA